MAELNIISAYSQKPVPTRMKIQSTDEQLKCDLAVGFDGEVQIFNLSHHFTNTKFDERQQISAFSMPKTKWSTVPDQSKSGEPVQITNKKCGVLQAVQPTLILKDCEVITFMQEVRGKSNGINSGGQYLIVGSVNCMVYVLNYATSETIYTLTTRELDPHSNVPPIALSIQTYGTFSLQKNPLIFLMTSSGSYFVGF